MTVASANWRLLYYYSDRGVGRDRQIAADAGRLAGILRHFEATCTEYRLSTTYLAAAMQQRATASAGLDEWVRSVGRGFEYADRGRVLLAALDTGIERVAPALRTAADWLDVGQLTLGSVLVTFFTKPGGRSGLMTIDFPAWWKAVKISPTMAREWARLSEKVNTIYVRNLGVNAARQWRGAVLVGLAISWGIDVLQYRGRELLAALAVDGVLVTATTLAGIAAVHVAAVGIGALLTVVALPVAVAAGIVLAAGVAVTVGISALLDKLQVREKAIDAVANRAIPWVTDIAIPWVRDTAVPAATHAVDDYIFKPVASTIAAGVDAVTNAVDDAGRELRSAWDGFTDWMGNAAQDVWHWTEDHRDEVALGLAALGAAAAVAATGGLIIPVLVGAAVAGGTTLAINAASDRYVWHDGLVQNTFNGALVGYGVGTAGVALQVIGATTVATPWAASTGAAMAQVTQVAWTAPALTYALTYAPPALQAFSGVSFALSVGAADIVIPEADERDFHATCNSAGLTASVIDLGLATAGNSLIEYAWTNPRSHMPGGSLQGLGNSPIIQSNHLYPQNQLGQLGLPAEIADDTVFLPTGPGGSFIPNLHTAAGGFHPQLAAEAEAVGFNTLSPLEQLDFLQGFHTSFRQQLMAPTLPSVNSVIIWQGLQGVPPPAH